jgi:hypothetical protein
MHDILSDVNKSRRELFLNFAIADKTEIVWEVTHWSRMFEGGSLHQIHGKTTTLHVNRARRGPGRGSSKVTLSQNGSGPGLQVLFYGSMENVRGPQLLRFCRD